MSDTKKVAKEQNADPLGSSAATGYASDAAELKKNLAEWLMAERRPPWNRYRIKETGQHCTVYSYSENSTMTVEVDGHDDEMLDTMNKVIGPRVFGINPSSLEIVA